MLSVVVPVYNVEQFLDRSIQCLIHQTYRDLEIILVDDGSTDKSGDICDKYQNIDNRIRVIHKENGGVISAWKTGIEVSKGEYLGFLDPDDYCALDYFQHFMETFEHYDADMVMGSYTLEYPDKRIIKKLGSTVLPLGVYDGERLEQIKCDFFKYKDTLLWNRVTQVVKRSVIVNNLSLVDPKIRVGDDVGIFIADFFDAQKIVLIDSTGYFYVQRDSSIMHTFKMKEVENFERLCKNTEMICVSKGRSECADQFLILQLLTTIFLILRSNLKRKEKKYFLKQLRETETAVRIFEMKDFGNQSFKAKVCLKMFRRRSYGLISLVSIK